MCTAVWARRSQLEPRCSCQPSMCHSAWRGVAAGSGVVGPGGRGPGRVATQLAARGPARSEAPGRGSTAESAVAAFQWDRGRRHWLPQAGQGSGESALLRAAAPHEQARRRISAQFAASKLPKNKERPILGDIAAAFKGAAFYHRRGCDASVFKAVLSVL